MTGVEEMVIDIEETKNIDGKGKRMACERAKEGEGKGQGQCMERTIEFPIEDGDGQWKDSSRRSRLR